MSETKNIKLFKHDNPESNNNLFDITKSLNENWDKIDEYVSGEENIRQENEEERKSQEITRQNNEDNRIQSEIERKQAEEQRQSNETIREDYIKDLKERVESGEFKGDPNVLTIGTVEGGEEASATIDGNSPNQILNLVLPKGAKGDKFTYQDLNEEEKRELASKINAESITFVDGETYQEKYEKNEFKGDKGDKGNKGDKGDEGNGIDNIALSDGNHIAGTMDTYTITYTDGTSKEIQIYNGKDGLGSGDMLREIYDINTNGIVDNAEKVNGHIVEKDVPENAIFTDTTYENATVDTAGLMSPEDKNKLDTMQEEITKALDYNNLTNKPKIPENTSDLNNDSNFQNKSEVNSLIATAVGDITQFDYQVIEELPEEGVKGTIYLKASKQSKEQNIYDEYIWLENEAKWEIIGSTQMDLSGYLKKTELVDLIYPIGSIYMSVNAVSPSTFLGGTWEEWASGRTVIGVNSKDTDFSTAEKEGGTKDVSLTTAQMPSHSHSGSSHTHSIGSHAHTYDKSSATTGSHTLTTSEMPSHNHSFSHYHYYDEPQSTTGSHTLTESEMPKHNHVGYGSMQYLYKGTNSSADSAGIATGSASGYKAYSNTAMTGGGAGHTHTISMKGTRLAKTSGPYDNSSTDSVGGGTGHTHTITTTSSTTGEASGNTGYGGSGSTGTTGNGEAHTNLQPYITCYMWKRVA